MFSIVFKCFQMFSKYRLIHFHWHAWQFTAGSAASSKCGISSQIKMNVVIQNHLLQVAVVVVMGVVHYDSNIFNSSEKNDDASTHQWVYYLSCMDTTIIKCGADFTFAAFDNFLISQPDYRPPTNGEMNWRMLIFEMPIPRSRVNKKHLT